MPGRTALLLWVGLTSVVTALRADDEAEKPSPSKPEQVKFFETRVRPVLAARCVKCHGADKQKGELRLDSRAAVLKGGESGAALVPGKPAESLLIEAVKYESYEMPPDGKLPDEQIVAIEAWVKMGVPWPAEVTLAPQASRTTAEDRAYWAFQPVGTPAVPNVDDAAWCRTEIDRFILRRLSSEGLTPAPEAGPLALIRRVYFDLIGLPPTPQEIDAYLDDGSPDKYERLIDRLLDDPRYGEKWARHWLDLVRYAESDGWRQDAFRPEAYKYRDYVVRSFNADKPYDRFVMEQIAGDEIDPGNADAITATAFLRHGIYEYNQRDVETQWSNILIEITDVTGDVFLGLGMACARCHDHKFDPIPQEDYFRLRAFFEPLVWREDQPQAGLKERAEFDRRQAKWNAVAGDIRRQLDEIERPLLLKAAGGQGFSKFAPRLQAFMLKRPEDCTPYEQQIASLAMRQLTLDRKKLPAQLSADRKAKWEKLREELAKWDDLKPPPLPTRKFAVSDVGPVAPPTVIPKDPKKRVIEPGFLSVLDEPSPKITPLPALQSSGRRTALARWLADPDNPLTTRVIVNRIWQHHFGTGLVATPSDFGHLGEQPSHPQLLDWLTRRFVADGWSFKKLHRLILTSAVYRQTARRPPPGIAGENDPENRLLWRMNSRRLDAEQIRDAMLYASGELDPRMGGPSVPGASPRRSIYVKTIRNSRYPMFDALDMADGLRCTATRNVTTTPTQALLMINGPFVLARAAAMAGRLGRMNLEDDDQLTTAAYRLAFGRPPTDEECRLASAFRQRQAAHVQPSPGQSPGAVLVETMPHTGTEAALLKPNGIQQRLQTPFNEKLPEGDFTVEAVVLLESLYADASVRTIVAHWDGDSKRTGWSLGVTSEKSAYRPRNLILQLVGKTAGGPVKYEVIPSNIHLKLNTPYSVAVSVDVEDTSQRGVRFVVDDLSVANEPQQIAEVPHSVIGGYRGQYALTIGGRDGKSRHAWDGLIDTVRLSRAALQDRELLINDAKDDAEKTVGHWRFEGKGGMLADSSGNGLSLRSANSTPTMPSDPQTAALIDFCHVLLNANEFIYLD